MLGVDDAVHDRVAEQHVRMGHVGLGAQHLSLIHICLALGINDFELLKKSLRNLALMFIVAIITSCLLYTST